MSKLKLLELFGGIGACSKALEKLGIDFEIVDYVEIDKYAVASFNAIHNTNFKPQDICTWDKNIEVDLIMHGSPCQDFSLAGLQAGGDEGSGTRSSLMYETLRIVEKLKPKYVIWENVKNVISKKHIHNFNNYLLRMENLGYKNYYQVLNAKDYGMPQNRERVFTISIRNDINKNFVFPDKQELKLKLKDMLEDNVDEKYYLSEEAIRGRMITNFQQYKLEKNVINNKDIHPTILARYEGAPTLFISNATKKGYLETTEGDGVDISSRMKYHRGTVQKEMIQTLDSQGGNSKGVVIKKDTPNYIEWEEEGKFESDCRAFKEDKISGAIVSTPKNKVLTIGNYMPSNHEASRIVDNEGLAPTVKENHGTVTATQDHLRIRKLTPKECWRLMGFDDEDYEKASKVCSNTQLYKQAGNSIVVNVIVYILKELL